MRKSVFAGLAVALLVMCCGLGDDDCPFPADHCEGACFAISGTELDSQRGCMADVFLGCTAGDDGTRETSTNCHSHPDTGRLVMVTGSDLAREPGWRACDAEEATKVVKAPRCDRVK